MIPGGTLPRTAVGGRWQFAGELLEVDPGTERGIRAGQDHGVDVRVGPGREHRVPQREGHRAAERVPRLRPVEGQGRNAPFDLDEDDGCCLGHCHLRSE